MFGRSRTSQQAATAQATAKAAGATTPKATGKGRPTPSRREAEARNRHPVVGAGTRQLRPDATKEERKAARRARKEAMATDRTRMREAMLTGDEKGLPARDAGPHRRFARDLVDSRRNVGEYLLPGTLVVLVLSMVRIPGLLWLPYLMLYAVVLWVIVDTYRLRRRVVRLVTEKYGADKARGIGTYAMMRAVQLRATRMPRAQVKRGSRPS